MNSLSEWLLLSAVDSLRPRQPAESSAESAGTARAGQRRGVGHHLWETGLRSSERARESAHRTERHLKVTTPNNTAKPATTMATKYLENAQECR